LSFTVNFDAQVFAYVSSALGNGVPAGANLGRKVKGFGNGGIGVLMDSVLPFFVGTRRILTITFNIIPSPPFAGVFPVTFSGSPTPLSVSGAGGLLLATRYDPGNIVINTSAAGVEISGRVVTPDGRGLRNAIVSMIDSKGVTRRATTSSFGYYRFDDVEVGEAYVMSVSSKRYRYTPRLVQVFDTLAEVNFVGLE